MEDEREVESEPEKTLEKEGSDSDAQMPLSSSSAPVSDKEEQYADEEEPEPTPKRKKKRGQRANDNDQAGDVQPPNPQEQENIALVNEAWSRSVKYDRSKIDWEARAREFLNAMIRAVEADKEAFQQGKPPLEKLRFMKRMKEEIVKVELQEYLLDQAKFLNACAVFVEPYDGELYPTPGLLNDILDVLGKLRVTSETFEDSEIVKALNQIPMTRGSELFNKRQKLLGQWQRTVIIHGDDSDEDDFFRRPGGEYHPEELESLRRDAMTRPERLEGEREVEMRMRELRGERGIAPNPEYPERQRVVERPRPMRKHGMGSSHSKH